MGHRIVRGIVWARKSETPQFASNSRVRGVRYKGIKYEKELGKALGSGWIHGQWFQFGDVAGTAFCQTDFLRELEDCVVVLEAKLSWVPEGHSQLELLYRPVIEAAFGKPMVGMQVCRRLVVGCSGAVAQTLPSALEAAKKARNVVLHWTGKGELSPQSPQRFKGPLSVASHTQ